MVQADREPLISVIVPIYKVEKYLKECIESIINQTYKNLEIILVDDGSPDNCGKICDDYATKDKRIKVIHKENGGVSSSRNIGLDIATGEWIGFVDGDDWIEKDFYEIFVKNIKKDDEILMCGLQRFDEEGVYAYCKPEEGELSINDLEFDVFLKYIRESLIGWTPTKLYRKTVVANLKFDNITLREDLCFNIEALRRIKKIRCINSARYNYRTVKTSILHTPRLKNIEGIETVNENIKKGFDRLNRKNNRRLYNAVMLECLIDVLLQDIIRNNALSEKEVLKQTKKIFAVKSFKKNLHLRFCKNNLQRLFVVLLKLNMPKLFIRIIKKLG